MDISRELFEQQRRPRFGTANPERMQLALWEWMIRGGEQPLPTQPDRADGPIWTFDRMGATQTPLADGRLVCVGGEHEDWYDPDFYIYNDVVVLGPGDRIEIYGYPREVFPPTDFHTATLVGKHLVVVGGLGYPADRRTGHTPVFRLDLTDYHIERVESTGTMPGWVHGHEAALDPTQQAIKVWGGELFVDRGGDGHLGQSLEEYELDLQSWTWRRLTARNWPQFAIRRADNGLFVLEDDPDFEAFRPKSLQYEVLPQEEFGRHQIIVEGVTVRFTVDATTVVIVVEGTLRDGLPLQIAEETRRNIEAAIHKPCVLDAY